MKEVNPKLTLYAEWLDTPLEDRSAKTQKAFSREHDVSEATLVKWKKQLAEQAEMSISSDDEIENFLKHLATQAVAGKNAQYASLYARIKGLDNNKSEDNSEVELTADQIARAIFSAELDLKESGDPIMEGGRVVQMPIESTILPDQV